MMTPATLLMIDQAAEAAQGRKEMRCQVAMADIYQAAGLLPVELAIPLGPRDAARWAERSQFRDWLEGPGSEWFEPAAAPAQPGDLLCFRLGHIEHHVAIQLTGGRLVHVFGGHGVRIAPCIPTKWAKRLTSIWRVRA